MKRIVLIMTLALSIFSLSGQTANDAITFGQQYHGGTARYMSMGGAFNALGGDFSTLSVNPAGIGIYRSNEFTFTGDLRFNETTTGVNAATTQIGGQALSPYSTSLTDTKSNFNFNSVGYVSGADVNSSQGLVRINYGFGFNRLKNYHKAYRGEVLNSTHSLTDNWAKSLNDFGTSGATTGAFIANQAYLMNTPNGVQDSYTSPLIEGATTDYIKDVVEEGKINEWVFSVGGNVDHWLYFGATFGLQDISIRKEYFQTEYFWNTSSDDSFYDGNSYHRYSDDGAMETAYEANDEDYFNYYSQEQIDGTGINGKFGVIVRPLDAFRFGLAIHTPTVNFIRVEQYADIYNNTYFFDEDNNENAGGEGYESVTPDDYRTISPYKLHGSAAVLLGKVLALDAEVDMIDYSSMKIKNTSGGTLDYQQANDAIKEMYKTSYNARVGAEFRVVPAMALRAGFSYYGSPYEDNIAYDASGEMTDAADYIGNRFDYSGGMGFRAGDFFLDLAYIHSVQENRNMLFDGAISPNEFYEMDLDQKTNRFMMTMGFKF